jgi:hypothetical protein
MPIPGNKYQKLRRIDQPFLIKSVAGTALFAFTTLVQPSKFAKLTTIVKKAVKYGAFQDVFEGCSRADQLRRMFRYVKKIRKMKRATTLFASLHPRKMTFTWMDVRLACAYHCFWKYNHGTESVPLEAFVRFFFKIKKIRSKDVNAFFGIDGYTKRETFKLMSHGNFRVYAKLVERFDDF